MKGAPACEWGNTEHEGVGPDQAEDTESSGEIMERELSVPDDHHVPLECQHGEGHHGLDAWDKVTIV